MKHITRLGFVVGLLAMISTASGCSNQTGQTATGPAPSDGSAEMERILDLWGRNNQDGALDRFLELHRTAEDDSAFSVFTMSEEEVVALSEAERIDWRQEKLKTSDAIGKFARFVREQATESLKHGQEERARRLVNALERLGRANSHKDLSEFARLTGEAIVDLANRPLESENESGDSRPSSGSFTTMPKHGGSLVASSPRTRGSAPVAPGP